MRIALPLALATLAVSLPSTAADPPRRTPVPAHARVEAATTSGPSYLQLGVNSSAADQVTFTDSQGASTDVLVTTSQTIAGGGCHYFWIAAGVKIPGGASDVFVQIGYQICGAGGTPYPFLFTSGSTIPTSNQWSVFPDALKSGTYYTFAFSTSGVANAGGTYDYEFTMQPRFGAKTVLATIPFESPNTDAPYLLSEIAGSSNACGDTLSVTYGPNHDAILSLKNGRWQEIKHVDVNYWYGPCSNSNVAYEGTEKLLTAVGPKVKQTTLVNAQLW